MATDKLTFLGTGTSYGIPQIGCDCSVCRSTDPRNARTRCSAILEAAGVRLLIDAAPDFRTQALREGISDIDGVFITHVHADHIFGLDDLRPLSLNRESPLPIFADAETASLLRQTFAYIFSTPIRRENVPWMVIQEIVAGEPFTLGEATFLPFPVEHGRWSCLGIRYGDFAYITDAKRIPAKSVTALAGIKTLCLDLLRDDPHPTHMSTKESLATVKELGSPESYFIHMGHEIEHASFDKNLPQGCQLAYDGLVISLD
ncbi:MAG: phosphoribosyl 1,2-cyclic phosphate phosphodiesterase [Planctomycetota bacterium]